MADMVASLQGLSDKMKDARRRFRWVFTDMERLSHVVESLRDHNDSLWQIMPRAEASSPASNQIAATCEAMSTIAALGLTLPRAANEIAPPPLGQTLSMIARRDVIEGIPGGTNPDIDLAFHEWKSKVSAYDNRGMANVDLSGISSGRQIAMYIKGHGKFRQDLDVMIEWKRYGAKATAQSMALERTDRVARLLSSASLPEDLRILKCVGYFHNPDRRCCGVLFQLPEALAGKGASTQAVTLAEELSNPYYASLGGGPSLADRLHLGAALARAVLKLHLSRWVHKDLRSDNIVFFKQRSRHGGVDLGHPYIASFGFARPDQWLLESESEYAPRDDGSLLAYCHPDYQHSTERLPEPASGIAQHAQPPSRRPRYHAAFDVYSLGCVLLEIGLWQPLESLGWRAHQEKKGADKREEWRDKLVRRAQRQLGFLCGAAYRDVVVKCLSTTVGLDGFDADESERVRDFCWTIMRVLENLRV